MRLRLVTTAGLLAAALHGATASADVVQISTLAQGSTPFTAFSDPQGPANAGALLSSGTLPCVPPDFACALDFAGDANAAAAQNVSGVGAVKAEGLFASGRPDLNTLSARASFSDTVTNDSGAAQSYTFDFAIAPAKLEIGDFAGLSDVSVPTITVSYGVEIRLDGVLLFSSGAELVGGRLGHVLNLSGTPLGHTFFGGGGRFGYDFNALVDSLDLGTLNDGESFTLTYDMFADVSAPGFETGGQARFGDPFNLDRNGGVAGRIVAGGAVPGVPEPATLVLLGISLLAVGATRARWHTGDNA